jgi:hypothetical protein
MRRMRRRVRRVVGAGVIPAIGFTGIPAVHAYPQDPNECNTDNLLWTFGNPNDPLWTADGVDRRTWVRQGLGTLDDALDHDGRRLASVQEYQSTQVVRVDIQDDREHPHLWGTATCFNYGSIWLNYRPTAAASATTKKRFFWALLTNPWVDHAALPHLVGR